MVVAMIGVGCADSDTTPSAESTTSVATTAVSTTTASTTAVSTTASPTTTAPTTTEQPTTTQQPTTTASTTTTLPGEEIIIGPQTGDVLGVVGVGFDDVLNVRVAPGVDHPIVATLAPTEAEVVAVGRSRLLPGSIWIEVSYDGQIGWVNLSFVAYLGGVDDATSVVVAELGTIANEATLTDLAETVAAVFASTDPVSRIVLSVAPTTGDLGEVTVDVIGLGDDASLGFRLHVFAQADGDRWSLKTIERTELCARGVSDDELCV